MYFLKGRLRLGLKGQAQKIDEFAFVLMAGVVLILVLTIAWGSLARGPVGVSPTEKVLTIARGDSKDFTLAINGTAINVTLQTRGEIANWISFEQNNFDVDGTTEVQATVFVPSDAEERIYEGKIDVITGTNKKTVDVRVQISATTVADVVKNIRFGDFSVSYSVGSETAGERSNFEVSHGYFSDYPATVVAVLTQDRLDITTAGEIMIEVDQTNDAGNLIVEFNGQQVYNQRASPGEIRIPVDKSMIKRSNNIVLRADVPGFRFWMNTVYKIKSASFSVDFFGVVSKDIEFKLTQSELDGFKFGKLSFAIRRYNPAAVNQLVIKINDEILYDDIPTIASFSKTFGIEIPLNVGTNEISFSVPKEAFYELNNVVLSIVREA